MVCGVIQRASSSALIVVRFIKCFKTLRRFLIAHDGEEFVVISVIYMKQSRFRQPTKSVRKKNRTRAVKGKESGLGVSLLFACFVLVSLSVVEFAFSQDKMCEKRSLKVITQMNVKDKGNSAIKIKQ